MVSSPRSTKCSEPLSALWKRTGAPCFVRPFCRCLRAASFRSRMPQGPPLTPIPSFCAPVLASSLPRTKFSLFLGSSGLCHPRPDELQLQLAPFSSSSANNIAADSCSAGGYSPQPVLHGGCSPCLRCQHPGDGSGHTCGPEPQWTLGVRLSESPRARSFLLPGHFLPSTGGVISVGR